jgi:uncharacterized protein YukE
MSEIPFPIKPIGAITELLMTAMSALPGWEGPSRTAFDREIRSIIDRLEAANNALDALAVAEFVVEAVV